MAAVFRLSGLSRVFRADGADWGMGIVGAAGMAAFVVLIDLRDRGTLRWQSVGFLGLALVTCTGCCGFWGVRSWRRLWRSGRTRSERMLYDYGVRGWGASMLLAMPLVSGAVVSQFVDLFHDPWAWLFLVTMVFATFIVGLPFFLWGGYAFGSALGDMFPDDRAEAGNSAQSDLPPAV